MPTSVRTFEIGALRCHAIDDGASTYATAAFLFATATQGEREEALRDVGEDPGAMRCSNTCLVLETGDARILIDAGSGALATELPGRENLGQLPAGLDEIGLAPGDIDIVFLTHLHSDHLWGCLGPTGNVPYFPNAEYAVHKTEWASAHPSVEDGLRILEPLVRTLDGETELVPGVRVLETPGHSPGHCAVHVASEGQELLVVGDAVAHWLNLEVPEWTMAHELDAAQAIATRQRLLTWAAKEEVLVHAYHMPFPSVGRIRMEDGAFCWEPGAA